MVLLLVVVKVNVCEFSNDPPPELGVAKSSTARAPTSSLTVRAVDEKVTSGWSLTDVMVMVLVTSPTLNGVGSPLAKVLAVSPAANDDLSQALNFIVAVPLKFTSGTKRTLWLALAPSSNSEEVGFALKFV